MNRPYHQWAIDDMQTLLATRYDAVMQRLLYPMPGEEAFTTVIHDAVNEASFCTEKDGEYAIQDCGSRRFHFDLDKSIRTIGQQESHIRDSSELSIEGAVVDLAIVTGKQKGFASGGFDPVGQLQWLVCFGLIGARNKPRLEDVQEVLRHDMSDAPVEHIVFRRAVKALAGRSLAEGEEEVLSKNLNKFEAQLDHPIYKEGAKAKLNRYYQGRVARRVLAALLHPFTTAQHVYDEIDVLYDSVEPAQAYMPKVSTLDGSVPTITLPWPILPPGDGPSKEVITRAPRGEITNRRVLDRLRTRWLGSVAARWPYGARFAKVELHNKSAENVIPLPDGPDKKKKSGDASRYRASILKGPDGKVFAVIADTTIAFPENAMYVGIVNRLRDEHGQPVNWRRVFRGAKSEARAFGAHQFLHAGYDVHARVLDYVCEAFEEQYGYAPAQFRQLPKAS